MTTKKKPTTKGKASQDSLSFNRRAVARTLAAARKEGTEAAYEGELIAQVLESKKLDMQTQFNTMSFVLCMFLKLMDLPATARLALGSDPTVARALYPHFKLALPDQFTDGFNTYFSDLAERVPHILDEIQRKTGVQ